MIESNQKQRDFVLSIIQEFDINSQPRDFIKSIAMFLDLQQAKICQVNMLADKIVQLYDLYRGQYDIYLTQLKFKQLNTDAKDFLWTIFKKYQQKINQRKFLMGSQNKPIGMREAMGQPMNSNTNQNLNMNMVNMFMDVPNYQSVQQIQAFQRKMFEIYKNFLPQVLSSVTMSMSPSQNQMYRTNPYQQYGMSTLSGVGGVANMTGMANMSGMAMPGMAAHSGLGGLSGLANNPGLANNNMNNPPSMTSLAGYSSKQQEYYEPSPFASRYFYDNKQPAIYNPNQSGQKSAPNDFRTMPMHMGFNYCGDRFPPEQARNSKHSDLMMNSKPTSLQQFQRRQQQQQQKQKFIGGEERRYDPYVNYNANQYSQLYTEKKSSRSSQRDRQYYGKEFSGQEPRKMHKKDEQFQQKFEELEQKRKSFKLSCVCKQGGICYYCCCTNLDPFNQVEQVLLMQKISIQNSKVSYTINKKLLEKIGKSSNRADIEIRCIKMEKQFCEQITWPERYSLSIDGECIQNYLSEPSSIKKRKESSFVLIKSIGTDKNKQDAIVISVQSKFIEQAQKPNNAEYALGIFLITKHTYQKMFDKLISKTTEQNISTYIKLDKLQTNQTRKQQFVLQTHEPTIKKLMKVPIRGKLCCHPECFDLQIFLSMLAIECNRQWKCPICGKDAKKLVIDNELKQILGDVAKMVKQPDEIIFYSDGSHEIRYKEQEKGNSKQSSQENAQD